MKRAILSLITIILLLSMCINAFAYCESFERTGKHINAAYVSDVHSARSSMRIYLSGLRFDYRDGIYNSFNMLSVHGNHNYYTLSVGFHTAHGHLVKLKCSTCGYTTSYYKKDDSCCDCVGHIRGLTETSRSIRRDWAIITPFPVRNAEKVIESGYTTLASCAICNCSHSIQQAYPIIIRRIRTLLYQEMQ